VGGFQAIVCVIVFIVKQFSQLNMQRQGIAFSNLVQPDIATLAQSIQENNGQENLFGQGH